MEVEMKIELLTVMVDQIRKGGAGYGSECTVHYCKQTTEG